MTQKEIVIGCEVEAFLAKNDGTTRSVEIVEPKIHGFPNDEMGFLLELRSKPSSNIATVIKSVYDQLVEIKVSAEEKGLKMLIKDRLYYDKGWVDEIAEKYDAHSFPDLTENVYGFNQSHHLGFEKHNGGYMLHSGLHIHFSVHEGDKKTAIPENVVERIIKRMDEIFAYDIQVAGRTKGEWEPKEIGDMGDLYRFEYRSLPCNTDLFRALPIAKDICREELEKESKENTPLSICNN